MTSALSITRAVNPPRAAFVDFPLGHTAGKPGDKALQRAIVRAALAGFETIAEAGDVVRLPFAWSDDDSWKDTALRGRVTSDGDAVEVRDERTERHGTPQYQCERDRMLAEHAQRESGCPTCVWLE
jgi:hypothetical protein